jgi:hypothetical protein
MAEHDTGYREWQWPNRIQGTGSSSDRAEYIIKRVAGVTPTCQVQDKCSMGRPGDRWIQGVRQEGGRWLLDKGCRIGRQLASGVAEVGHDTGCCRCN